MNIGIASYIYIIKEPLYTSEYNVSIPMILHSYFSNSLIRTIRFMNSSASLHLNLRIISIKYGQQKNNTFIRKKYINIRVGNTSLEITKLLKLKTRFLSNANLSNI